MYVCYYSQCKHETLNETHSEGELKMIIGNATELGSRLNAELVNKSIRDYIQGGRMVDIIAAAAHAKRMIKEATLYRTSGDAAAAYRGVIWNMGLVK